MIYALCAATSAFAPNSLLIAPTAQRAASVVMAVPNAAPIYDGEYAAELRQTAATMVAKGKGLLACDESTGTVGTRLEANGSLAFLQPQRDPHLLSWQLTRVPSHAHLRASHRHGEH